MLENWNKPHRPEKEELEERLKVANEKLFCQQMMIKERGLPVLVLFEGWGCNLAHILCLQMPSVFLLLLCP